MGKGSSVRSRKLVEPSLAETRILHLRGRDLVEHYVREERKANDRRRIMYTNHSVDRILDARGDIVRLLSESGSSCI
jgi:hypothetical protein